MADTVSCELIGEVLVPYWNRELAPDALDRVASHLAACAACDAFSRHVQDALCGEVYKQVYSYLDRELAPDDRARVEQHLAACKRCQDHFQFDGRVLRYVRANARPTASSEPDVERILTRFRARLASADARHDADR